MHILRFEIEIMSFMSSIAINHEDFIHENDSFLYIEKCLHIFMQIYSNKNHFRFMNIFLYHVCHLKRKNLKITIISYIVGFHYLFDKYCFFFC